LICVEVTEAGVSLGKVASDMPVLAKAMLKKAFGYAKGRAEELTPVRTGLMKQSWYVTEQGDLNIALSNRAPYFLYFIEGTSPHEIRPRFASALCFKVGDEVVFARLVNHPGTKPSDLLLQVKKGTEQETPRFFAQAWDEVTDYEEY
jgi:hypothetical protein